MAIYDSDILYATRLMEYIQSCKQYDYYVYLFSEKEKLKDFIEHNATDVLLKNVNDDIEEICFDKIKKVYDLTELYEEENSNNIIYKYQSAKNIIESIYDKSNFISKNKNKSNQSGKNIISVVMPSAGYNKSIFLWSFIKNLSDRSKLLYIPIELFPISLVQQVGMKQLNLSEFLLYLKENNSNLILKLKSLIQELDNFFCLQGITHGLDILSLSIEDIGVLIDLLKSVDDFDTIVFSISFFDEITIELMKQSNMIYALSYEGFYEEGLWKEWERQLLLSDIEFHAKEVERIILQENISNNIRFKTFQELTTSSIWPMAKYHVDEIRKKAFYER